MSNSGFPQILGVTIGVGPNWEEMAELAAESVRLRTGLETRILGAAEMARYGKRLPHHLKFKLFEAFPEAETWHFDAVGGTICLPDREPEWIWFGERHRLPPPIRRFACGMKPSSCSLFSSRALAAMVELLGSHPFSVLSELRLGTLAAAAGFLPVPNPRSNATISWRPRPEMPLVNGIFHPLKHHSR